MGSKRTAQINVKLTPESKEYLEQQARKLKWTLSTLTEQILQDWINENKEGNKTIYNFINMDNRYSNTTINN